VRLVAYNIHLNQDIESDLRLYEEEIYTFNKLSVILEQTRWLGKNQEKKVGTMTFIVEQERVEEIKEKGLKIFGNYCKVVLIKPFSTTTRCYNC